MSSVLGGGGGSGGGGNSEVMIRYPHYIETRHDDFLGTVQAEMHAAIHNSPFATYTDVEIDDAFFGAGYLISSFPSLYDMYGKFMAGLDVEDLYGQIFEDTVNAPEINDLVSAEADLMDDDIDTNVLPRFQTGLRDINSVMSSSFVVGKSVIEDARVKSLSKFSAELKFRMIPVAVERWKEHLNWNKQTVLVYSEIMKLYFSAKLDVDRQNFEMAAKNLLWPFTVLDYERAALGALQGAQKQERESGDKTSSYLSSIVSLVGIAAMFA
jgi:hypothetical protein